MIEFQPINSRIQQELSEYLKEGVSVFDALLAYSEVSGIEVEVLGEAVKRNSNMYSILLNEARENNMLRNTEEDENITTLPV